MSISCILGLTACLSYGGEKFAAQDAFEILDNCDFMRQIHVSAFDGATGMGIAVAEAIEKKGLKLDWPKGGSARKAVWLRTCNSFHVAFNDRRLWSDLDKWPN